MNNYIRRFVRGLLVIVVLAAAICAPIILQTQADKVASDQLRAQDGVTRPVDIVTEHGSHPWTYDFAGKREGALSRREWGFETGVTAAGYNDELQAYTARPANVRVHNGTLVIEARPEHYQGKDYTSGRITTRGLFDFTYGTLEVDMKLPEGVGSWPAAWLRPVDDTYKLADYGIAPSDPLGWALNGEIDFAEAVGYIPGQNIPAIHSYDEVHQAPTYTPAYIPDSATAFHRYGVIKTPDKITFTIDGVPYNTRIRTGNNVLDWPYNQPYYLILNLAVGGKWAGAHGVDTASMPWQLQIRSISYSPKY